MKFNPKEIELLPNGTYEFLVEKAEDRKGPKADYLNLTLKVKNSAGNSGTMFCMVNTAKKLYQFCQATSADLVERFLGGIIVAQECVGKRGRCEIGSEVDPNGKWDDKNIVKTFYKIGANIPSSKPGYYQPPTKESLHSNDGLESPAQTKTAPDVQGNEFDDDIPF